jgi:hypothetical protein
MPKAMMETKVERMNTLNEEDMMRVACVYGMNVSQKE